MGKMCYNTQYKRHKRRIPLGAQLRVRPVEGFARRQNHDLAKLLRGMNKESEAALEVLMKLMASTDEKIRLDAVRLFLTTYKDVAKDINNDQFTRLLANHKYKGPQQLEVEDDDTPMIDFNNITDV